jgi:enoyl-CoA hydratase/carnithine racemase
MAGTVTSDSPAEGVLRLSFDNAEKRGALDHAILDSITESVEQAEARAIIITGSGDFFSSGYDIGHLPAESFAEDAEKLVAHPFTNALEALDATNLPTVCAVNGPAIGGGLELALSCDLRVSVDSAKFGMPPAKLGLVYSHTGMRRFIDAIGVPRTRELFLVGRRIDAATALQWGLVNDLAPAAELEARALDLASELAGNAPLSISGNKRVIRELLKAQGELAPDVEAELIALREASFASEDMREGIVAFGEKRPPRWQGK